MKKGNAKILSIFHIRDLFNLEISKDYGLNYHEISALDYLKNKGKTSQSNLVKRLRMDKSSVTKIVNKLVKEGFITRDFDPADLRYRVLSPTQKLMDINLPIMSFTDAYFEALTKDFSKEEILQFYGFISKMHKKAKGMRDNNFEEILYFMRAIQNHEIESESTINSDEFY